jgi:hypothetical protein
MDKSNLQLWFDIAQFLATGAIGVYVYISNKDRVTNTRITELEGYVEKRLDNHASRIATVEETVKHIPSHGDIGEVRDMIGRVGGDVKGLAAEVKGVRDMMGPMQNTIALMNEFLLKQNQR